MPRETDTVPPLQTCCAFCTMPVYMWHQEAASTCSYMSLSGKLASAALQVLLPNVVSRVALLFACVAAVAVT